MATAAVRRRLTWQPGVVAAAQPESPRARRLVLAVPDWQRHVPGQHLDLRLTAADGYTAQRSYSIASAPEEDHVELVVQEVDGGEVSPFLTHEVRDGDTLEVRGPVGGYFVWHAGLGGPVQLIAGGSGVVPFLSMLAHHRATGSETPVRLLLAARAPDEVLGRPLLDRAPSAVDVTLLYSREVPPGWAGPTGRVSAALLADVAYPPAAAPQVFVCGPNGFVDAATAALVELGHPAWTIKTERFGG